MVVVTSVQSSEETAATESYYILVSRNIIMAVAIQGPCGRRSMRY